jgi:histidinol phosphatase-like PHP family hydrolase
LGAARATIAPVSKSNKHREVNMDWIVAHPKAIYWTEPRMRKVIEAVARNGVAIELNNRCQLPRPPFVRMAREAGCRFSLGSNNGSLESLGRSEHGLRMIEECKLRWQDFFVPGAWGPKAVERKPQALRA